MLHCFELAQCECLLELAAEVSGTTLSLFLKARTVTVGPKIAVRPTTEIGSAFLKPKKAENGSPPPIGPVFIDHPGRYAGIPAKAKIAAAIDVQLGAKRR